jgi:hypothetical protein
MKAGYSFDDVLRRLAQQSPEEKMRIAFQLNTFVKKLHKAGMDYAETQRHRAGRTA